MAKSNKKRCFFLLVGFLGFLGFSPMPALAQSTRVKVGVAGSPPFAIKEGSRTKGISVEIWQEIAAEENLEYELIPQESVAATIEAVKAGELNVGIGPISITSERLEQVDFTQPFFVAEIGLLLPSKRPTLWGRIKPFFGVAFLSSVAILLAGLFVVGNLLWLAERRRNREQFPANYWRGVGNGMWFAIVTLTTVGYGDRAPITKTGRAIASVWMIITMVTVSSLTAGIATTLTLSLSDESFERFVQPEDINGASIAVVSNTTGERWAQEYGANLKPNNTLEEAIALLIANRVDGVVFDTPAIQYYLSQNPQAPLRLAEFSFTKEKYGFAFPNNSPLLEQLNVALVQLEERGIIAEIEAKYLETE